MTTSDILLSHAETFARERGFSAFSFADLAQAAGIRKASVHHHFATKDRLALVLMSRYRAEFAAHLAQATSLRDLVALYRAALREGQTLCLCVAFSAAREKLSAEVMQEVDAFRTMVLAWIETRATPADLPAASVFALLEGAQLTAFAAKDMKLFDAAVAVLETEQP